MRLPLVLVLVVATGLGCTATPVLAPGSEGADARCGTLRDALQTVRYHLQLLIQLDDAEAYDELRDADAPFKVDPQLFRQAIAVLAVLTGVESEANRLRRIAELLEQNLGVEDPFTEGSRSGEQLHQLAQDAFGQAQVVLDQALVAAGCPLS